MKKFVFSLEKVLGYKRQVLDLLKSELSRLQAQCRELERQIEHGNREFENTNHLLIVKMRRGMTPQDIAAYKSYLGDLNRRVLALQQERQKAAQAVAAKQEEIVRMNSDISGLEHLKDRQLADYRSQERKEQETLVEEFVGHSRIRVG
jgi:flagellar export protein FliJ